MAREALRALRLRVAARPPPARAWQLSRREAGIPAEVYHIKASGEKNWPKEDELLDRIGIHVEFRKRLFLVFGA